MFGRSKSYSLVEAEKEFTKNHKKNFGSYTNKNDFYYFNINNSVPHAFSLEIAKKLIQKNIEKSKLREYLGELIKIEISLGSISKEILQVTQIKDDQTQLNYYASEVLNHLRKGISNTIALHIYQINNDTYNKLREKKDSKSQKLADKVMFLTISLFQAFEHLTKNDGKLVTKDIAKARKVIFDSVNNQKIFKQEFERWYLLNKDGFKEFFKEYFVSSNPFSSFFNNFT